VKLSIVIPAYNEEKNIKIIIKEILDIVKNISSIGTVQVVIVDDHSSDKTFDTVSLMDDPRITCLRLSKRYGSHIALRAGIQQVTGDAVLCISADGQDDPHVLNDMIKKWTSGNHIIWALRKQRKDPFFIKWSAYLFYKMLKKLTHSNNARIDLSRADFYLLDRKVSNAVNQCPERNTSLFGLINWLGFKQDYVEYTRRERYSGKSKWSFRSRLYLSKDWIIAFSGLPLIIMSVIGVFVSVVGFLYAMFIVVYAILGNPVQGWASLMVVVLILGGLQMTMLGIIGEYLWRNFNESRRRPLYFIEKRTQKKPDE
jgi:glycosyltransferase involved in cell wall biosynthesis